MPVVKDEKGNVVSRQSYTPEGESKAEQIASANPSWEVDYAPGGTSDAMGRSITNYAGGGQTGYNAVGNVKPMYKEGGDVPEKKKEEGAEIFGMSPSEQKELAKKVGKAIKTGTKKTMEFSKKHELGKKATKAAAGAALAAVGGAGVAKVAKIAAKAGPAVTAAVSGAVSGVVKDIKKSTKVTDAELDARIEKDPYLGDYPREALRKDMEEEKRSKKKGKKKGKKKK